MPSNRWIALSRAILQSARRKLLPQRHHGIGSARPGPAKLHYFDKQPNIFHRAADLSHCDVPVALRDFSTDPDDATPSLFRGIQTDRSQLRSSSASNLFHRVSYDDAAALHGYGYFAGEKVRCPGG